MSVKSVGRVSDVDDESDAGTGGRRRDRGQRERVLQLVREHDRAVDAAELASQTGLHVTTVRFHLDALCDDELIVRTRMKLPGRGRPRTGYLAVEEPLDYRVLAGVLAMELGQTVETRGRRAQHAGQKWAARIPDADGRTAEAAAPTADEDPLDRATLRAVAVFRRMGFAPELADPAKGASKSRREKTIRLQACPVRELARTHPEVGCGVHLGLLQGLLANVAASDGSRRASRPPISAHLEPFVTPDLCLAKLVAD
jgi:predicted ArsR family transcriptional regulator